MTDYLKEKWLRLMHNFRPFHLIIQPTHVQSWDAHPKRRKK